MVGSARAGQEVDERLGAVGFCLAPFRDLDGDKVPDFLVGAPKTGYHKGLGYRGALLVVSAKRRTVLWTAPGLWGDNKSAWDDVETHVQGLPGASGRAVVVIGDCNKDGVPDIVSLGNTDGRLLDGRSGKEIFVFARDLSMVARADAALFHAVAPCGDADADGVPDFAIGNRHRAGGVEILSGKDGSVLREFKGDPEASTVPGWLASLGDGDGDGVHEILVGALDKFGARLGRLRVLCVRDGTSAPYASDGIRAWSAFTPVGDVDGDGHAELAISIASLNKLDDGGVRLLSGKDGREIWSVKSPADEPTFGIALAPHPDFDGDGVVDLLVGSPLGVNSHKKRSGSVRVYSCKTGRELRTPFLPRGDKEGEHFGMSIAVVEDLDGDGVADYLVGAPSAADKDGDYAGCVRAFSPAKSGPLWSFGPDFDGK